MNMTLSVSEEVLRNACGYAEEHGTSVEQIIRDYLSGLSQGAERRQRAKAAMEFFENFVPTVPVGTHISRDEMEER